MPSGEAILVHDSDSEIEEQPAKRQKTRPSQSQVIDLSGESMDVDPKYVELMKMATKNATLKGRKRFNADLKDAKEAAKGGLVIHGLKLHRLRAGDEEGSVEVAINKTTGEHVLALNLLVSDTSDYMKEHNFFSYSQDADVHPDIQEIIGDIANDNNKTIVHTVDTLCRRVGAALGIVSASTYPTPQSHTQELEPEDDDDEDGYESYDDFVPLSNKNEQHNTRMSQLRDDFVEIVANGYRPAIINFGADDFCLSVSIPVVELAESIPPQALMAWDRRLLSKTQHLTLLVCGLRGIYPVLSQDGSLVSEAARSGVNVNFKVGLSARYKPGKDNVREASRNFGLILQDAEDVLRLQQEEAERLRREQDPWNEDEEPQPDILAAPVEEEEEEDEGRFDPFALTNSLQSLMDQSFLKIVAYRCKFGLGWSGAELLLAEVENSQKRPDDVYALNHKTFDRADAAERKLLDSYDLPQDPLRHRDAYKPINLLLVAFCYLVRRLTLCTRYCVVCHNELSTDFEALKPYICEKNLCQYQYYSLNRGPSLEYEIIHNPQTVDILLSLTYLAAAEGVLADFPTGLNLRVPKPDTNCVLNAPMPRSVASISQVNAAVPNTTPKRALFVANDGLCEFDDLTPHEMRASIVEMTNMLPPVAEMRKHLLRKAKVGKAKPKLQEAESSAPAAAWQIMRWCIGSCTAYLEEINTDEERIGNLDASWAQYRFIVGAPDAEAKFKSALEQAKQTSVNANRYPSIFAFHGSAARNWHSIIRNGLWFKDVINGRAYGNGVYLAKEGSVSLGTYSQGARVSGWKNSRISPTACAAVAEIVNLPEKFVSHNPYFVIQHTEWIMCRYLLVKGSYVDPNIPPPGSAAAAFAKQQRAKVPIVSLDPTQNITMNQKHIQIPEPSYQITKLMSARKSEMMIEDPDSEDRKVFDFVEQAPKKQNIHVVEDSDDDMMDFDIPQSTVSKAAPITTSSSSSKGKAPAQRLADDWKHDPKWVQEQLSHLMPPPLESTPSATMAVQRELKTMLKEQEQCASYKELGWYMPEEFMGDNLFQWIVEMHSFDPDIPIAKDLKAKKVNSLIFEIRFPPNFPLSPPFFRIISPRFLPFIHGGGGHVTGGGSICMDLLTSDGWLPSYSISAVLMQIKLAISNLDPRPARLAQNWSTRYGIEEALAGYKRAAATHGWQLPPGLDKLVS